MLIVLSLKILDLIQEQALELLVNFLVKYRYTYSSIYLLSLFNIFINTIEQAYLLSKPFYTKVSTIYLFSLNIYFISIVKSYRKANRILITKSLKVSRNLSITLSTFIIIIYYSLKLIELQKISKFYYLTSIVVLVVKQILYII